MVRLFCAKLFSCLFVFSLAVPAAFAGESGSVGIGIGVGVTTSEYRKTDSSVWPLPYISYEGERFYARGLTAGVHLFKNRNHELSVNASYHAQRYDASDSDSYAMRRLDDRHSTMMVGLGYRLTTDWGILGLGASADVLGTSDGILVDGSYAYPIRADILTVTPQVGVLWTSARYNDYYYGISGKESRKSGYGVYDADDGFSPYAGVNVRAGITDNFSIMLNSRVTFMNDEITDSPMVNRDAKLHLGAGVAFSF